MAGCLSAALRARWAGAAVGCLLAAALVGAQASADCAAQPAHAHAQTMACAAQAFAEVDETIAVLYADVRRALSAHEHPLLTREHSAWRRERERLCPAPAALAAATNSAADAAQRQHLACLTHETQARRRGLLRWLSMDSPADLP